MRRIVLLLLAVALVATGVAKPKKKVNESLQVVYGNLEEQLKLIFGTKVSILSKGDEGAGKVEIEFYSHDDLDRIVEIIKRR